MTFEEIERLVRLVAETNVAEVEVTQGGVHVRVVRQGAQVMAAMPVMVPAAPGAPVPAPAVATAAEPAAAVPASPAPAEDVGLHVITATMVGTFYRRPNPEAPPFIREGDVIKKGQVFCLLEAMKILNEIESDVSGTVAKVFAEDGQPVEFGEKLIAVRLL